GDDPPDTLGQVKAIMLAFHHGAPARVIAASCGVSIEYIKAHLALGQVDAAFREYLVTHALSPRIALMASRLQGDKQEAFIKIMMSRPFNVAAAKERYERLRDFEPPTPALALGTPAEVNAARIEQQVWNQALENDPDDA
ncbi:MAG: hypothetical protein V3R81_11930, partial [Gammaproteobacteria bacterium]